jgi:hypothetical protein
MYTMITTVLLYKDGSGNSSVTKQIIVQYYYVLNTEQSTWLNSVVSQ